MSPFTTNTITDLNELEDRLARIRETRVAVVDGEYNDELLCVSSPVLDDTKLACAAITVAMLSSKATEERVRSVATMVEQAADGLSRGLGYLEDGAVP